MTRTETLSDLRSLVVNITSRTNGFNFLDILTGVHSVSTWPLFRLIVGPDERNNDRNIIKVSLLCRFISTCPSNSGSYS